MPHSEDGCPESLLVLPWTDGEPDYRDKYRKGPQEFTGVGFFFYNVGPYANAPEMMVPGKCIVLQTQIFPIMLIYISGHNWLQLVTVSSPRTVASRYKYHRSDWNWRYVSPTGRRHDDRIWIGIWSVCLCEHCSRAKSLRLMVRGTATPRLIYLSRTVCVWRYIKGVLIRRRQEYLITNLIMSLLVDEVLLLRLYGDMNIMHGTIPRPEWCWYHCESYLVYRWHFNLKRT